MEFYQEWLLDILACPISGKPLEQANAGDIEIFGINLPFFVTKTREFAYPIEDGIPQLVREMTLTPLDIKLDASQE